MKLIKAPEPLDFDRTRPSVFLAGSIEQGAAEDWQTTVVTALQDCNITILNPRRDAWDASWLQTAEFATRAPVRHGMGFFRRSRVRMEKPGMDLH